MIVLSIAHYIVHITHIEITVYIYLYVCIYFSFLCKKEKNFFPIDDIEI